MKNWWWFLAISAVFFLACRERNSVDNAISQPPVMAELMNDSPPPVQTDVDIDYQEDQNKGNSGGSLVGPPNQRLEPTHIGTNKGFPGKTRSDFFTGKQAMVDSTSKALMLRNHIRDSLAGVSHPIQGDTMKNRHQR